MCYYLTATLAPKGDEDAVRELALAFGLNWIALENPSLRQTGLVEGERYFSTALGQCDCGTLIGQLDRSDGRSERQENWLAAQAMKRRQQGWSESKIERWLAEKQNPQHDPTVNADIRAREPASEISRWLAFISGIGHRGLAQWVGILKHWYTHRLDNEVFPDCGSVWLTSSTLDSSTLLHLKDDVLYRIRFPHSSRIA